MPQRVSSKRVQIELQMSMALQLRASGASYEQIGKALNPSVSKTRAYRIIQKALEQLASNCQEKAESIRQLHLIRLNRMRLSLDVNRKDPRVASVLLQIMEREAKLLGLDAPQKVAATDPEGKSLAPESQRLDLSKLTLDELLELERLQRKMAGEGKHDPS